MGAWVFAGRRVRQGPEMGWSVITVVGHADLSVATLDVLADELPGIVSKVAPVAAIGVVRAGAGLPVVFGRAVCRSGLPLLVVLPGAGGAPAPLPERDHVAAGELLFLAQHVRLLSYRAADPLACRAADERLIESSRLVVAVWDGSWSAADGTGHLVAYARGRGIRVEVVWPEGRRGTLPRFRSGSRR